MAKFYGGHRIRRDTKGFPRLAYMRKRLTRRHAYGEACNNRKLENGEHPNDDLTQTIRSASWDDPYAVKHFFYTLCGMDGCEMEGYQCGSPTSTSYPDDWGCV